MDSERGTPAGGFVAKGVLGAVLAFSLQYWSPLAAVSLLAATIAYAAEEGGHDSGSKGKGKSGGGHTSETDAGGGHVPGGQGKGPGVGYGKGGHSGDPHTGGHFMGHAAGVHDAGADVHGPSSAGQGHAEGTSLVDKVFRGSGARPE